MTEDFRFSIGDLQLAVVTIENRQSAMSISRPSSVIGQRFSQ